MFFGLGGAGDAEKPRLEVRWPNGRRQRFLGPPADRLYRVSAP
jgi:ASPIC and UnbV